MRLFLLDAYALIFRAYYALIKMPRVTQSGFNTSAIFGFVNTLEEILRKEKPSHLAVCFDPPGPTFRDEAFEDYKGERAPTPEDIKLSVPIIKEILKAYQIPVVEVPGFEADDVIGTLATQAAKVGFTTYMMTPDKDFGQLVSPQILQYKPAYRGQDFELRGEKEVCERYGLERTEQVIDLLALMGDKVDNIPGCPGVGEKTAVKLIQTFGTVENLLANTDQLKGAQRTRVEENKEQILFSKFLATIRTDAPIEFDPKDMLVERPDTEKLFAIFRELEFNSLIDRVGRRIGGLTSTAPRSITAPAATPKPAKSINAAPSLFDDADFGDTDNAAAEIAAPAEFNLDNVSYNTLAVGDEPTRLAERLTSASQIGIALVAEGDNDMAAQFKGIAIAVEPGEAWYIPAEHQQGVALALDTLARADLLKLSENVKRDYVIAARLRNDNDTPIENYFDVALAHYLIQPEMRHNLQSLASTYLYHEIMLDGDTANTACEKADVTLRLHEPMLRALTDAGMTDLYNNLELPLVPVLADMELTGVTLDVEALNKAAAAMATRISDIEREVCEMAGEQFNVGSPAKVGEILFDKLKLDEKAKKTKTGQYSTSEEILEKLTAKHPIVAKILEFRALKKLHSTYLVALPAAINPTTGKVHTNYNQTVTATGRISSTSPNLQNIPVRDDEGREIRRAFIADPGHLFLSADYSQIELRLVADFANDETMLEAFRNGDDIHSITAARIYHKEIDEVTDNERRKAKTANFGIIYGISAFGLSQRLSIPRAEAKEIIDNYFGTFPTIRQYMEESVASAREQGFVTTRIGRKRMLPDINSRNTVVRGYAERNAINAPIQGSAADVIKRAMVDIWRELRERGLKSKMIMQVHDELNFDVLPDELPQIQELVSRNMEAAYQGRVRLTASSGVATNWLDAH